MADPALLLVHGAWHGAWCWDAVLPALRTRHQVHTVDLPASRGDGRMGLVDDVATVHAAIESIDGPTVVLGHSSGGVAVTVAAAGDDAVTHIIYLAAFVPDVGESTFDLFGGDPAPWQVIDGDLVRAGSSAQPAASIFYDDVDDVTAAAATARLRPQARRFFTDEATAAAWRTIPCTYVATGRDRAFPIAAQEQMAARAGAEVRRLDSGHSPFLSMPEKTASLVSTIIRAA